MSEKDSLFASNTNMSIFGPNIDKRIGLHGVAVVSTTALPFGVVVPT